MKVVCFKIEGEKYTRIGPAEQNATIDQVTMLLARVFCVEKNKIKILELS